MSYMYQIAMRVLGVHAIAIAISVIFFFAIRRVAITAAWVLQIVIKIRVWLREYQLNRISTSTAVATLL